MKSTHAYTAEQRIKWFGEGEWVDEPDLVEFEHCGLKCEVRRIVIKELTQDEHIFGGHLCGYVQVPGWSNIPEGDFDIDLDEDPHGGITFNGVSDNIHWVGFDCAHSGDIVPCMEKYYKSNPELVNLSDARKRLLADSMMSHLEKNFTETYKNIEYVISETKKLAESIKKKLS